METKITKTKIYASFDIEADGNNPCQHSMLSLGISFMTVDGAIVDEVQYNMIPRHDRTYETRCITDFWMKPEQQKAWESLQQNQVTPHFAMADLATRLTVLTQQQQYEIEWVAYPSCFDWMFLKCYYEEFGPKQTLRPDIGYCCTDIGSQMKAIASLLNKPMGEFTKFFRPINQTPHIALADARTQGRMFVNFVKWRASIRQQIPNIEINTQY